ncbi:MAG: helix-turn-helix transcriptional regulator [Archangium sp.]|nr:helix-turn-helix transcriptional regulator [Archangium sp.]
MENGSSSLPPHYLTLPDGTADLVIARRDGVRRAVLVGPSTRALLKSTTGLEHVVVARLLPGVVTELLGVPVGSLRDRVSPLAAVGHRRLNAIMRERSVEAMAAALGSWLDAAPRSAECAAATQALLVVMRSEPEALLRTVANEVACSERSLRRLFAGTVGVPPGRCQGLSRVRRAVHALVTADTAAARVAVETGYADQAHLTRDVRARVSMTPAALRAKTGGTSPLLRPSLDEFLTAARP